MEKKAEEEEQGRRSDDHTKDDGKKGSSWDPHMEGLPGEVKDSPYMRSKDLEDYNRRGYGTEGHLQPKPGRGAGATDAPTPSGAAPVSSKDGGGTGDASSTDTINRHGVP